MDFNMFLALWFTLLCRWRYIYYQHCTVSVSYQPYPSFRQNAGEFEACRIPYRNKRRETELDWQKLAVGGLNWVEKVHFSTRKDFICHNNAKSSYPQGEVRHFILYFSFLLQFRETWMPTGDVGPFSLHQWFVSPKTPLPNLKSNLFKVQRN